MEALKRNHNKIITLKQAKKVIILLIVVLCFDFLLFAAPAMASQIQIEEIASYSQEQGIIADSQSEINENLTIDLVEFNGKLPENNDIIRWSEHYVITAYNSGAGQTDDSPCITANNFNVCDNGVEDTIAANFLPFGSRVKIPELFGDRIFIVRDRMNRRFSNRVDVWMIERPDAVKFGVKMAKIEVLR